MDFEIDWTEGALQDFEDVVRYVANESGSAVYPGFLLHLEAEISSSNVRRASSTASAIASLVTVPLHSASIVSQAIPLATCFSTCVTMIRVTTNVGLP